jgi:hypothetical protein
VTHGVVLVGTRMGERSVNGPVRVRWASIEDGPDAYEVLRLAGAPAELELAAELSDMPLLVAVNSDYDVVGALEGG